MDSPAPTPPPPEPLDRRARRRQETIEEILDIAQAVMAADGVNALSLSEIARRLGVQPPSLYTNFPSLMALYDAIFERGSRAHVENASAAVAAAPPGLAAVLAWVEAEARWAVEHQAVAQLLYWRPVPSFVPSEQAMAPVQSSWANLRAMLAETVRLGELGPGADSDEAADLVIIWGNGIFATTAANEPGCAWGDGRFTPHFPKVVNLLTSVYPPRAKPRRTKA
jgi:AcrR family transcriptional regulator